MAQSKVQKYDRLSRRAGIAASVCLIIWIVSVAGAVFYEDERRFADWIGVACGLSFVGTVACAVTCLAAAVLGRFKSQKPET